VNQTDTGQNGHKDYFPLPGKPLAGVR